MGSVSVELILTRSDSDLGRRMCGNRHRRPVYIFVLNRSNCDHNRSLQGGLHYGVDT